MNNQFLLIILFIAIVFVMLVKRFRKNKRKQDIGQEQTVPLIPEETVKAIIPESVMEQLPEDMIDSLPHNDMVETFDDVRSIHMEDIEPYNDVDGDNYFYINKSKPMNVDIPDVYETKIYENNKQFSNVKLFTVCIIFILTLVLLYGITFTRKLK